MCLRGVSARTTDRYGRQLLAMMPDSWFSPCHVYELPPTTKTKPGEIVALPGQDRDFSRHTHALSGKRKRGGFGKGPHRRGRAAILCGRLLGRIVPSDQVIGAAIRLQGADAGVQTQPRWQAKCGPAVQDPSGLGLRGSGVVSRGGRFVPIVGGLAQVLSVHSSWL